MKLFETYLTFKEELLYEGKNLEKTIQMYLPRFKKEFGEEGLEGNADQYYSDEIKDLVAADPTYKTGSNYTGDYGTWILDRYLKDRSPEYFDLNNNRLSNLIKDFIDVKQSLPNKDIGSYKSFRDLRDAINSVTLTNRQEQRRKRHSRDYHQVYEDDKWEIFVPDTFRGSCTLGSGTGWCTAYTENDERYRYYSSQGPLYVIISKDDPNEKYQFHFPSDQFMDDNNTPISVAEFFMKEPSLLKFFVDKEGTDNNFILRYLNYFINSMSNGEFFVYIPDDGTFRALYFNRYLYLYGVNVSSQAFDMFMKPWGPVGLTFPMYRYSYRCKDLNQATLRNLFRGKQLSSYIITKIKEVDPSCSEINPTQMIDYLFNQTGKPIFDLFANSIFTTLAKCNGQEIVDDIIDFINSWYQDKIIVRPSKNKLWSFSIKDKRVIQKAFDGVQYEYVYSDEDMDREIWLNALNYFDPVDYIFDANRYLRFDIDVFEETLEEYLDEL